MKHTSPLQWLLARCCIGIVLLALTSCTTQRLHRGASLIEKGRYEEGLAKLEHAVAEDGRDVKARMALYANRERVIEDLRKQAEQARAAGDIAEADAIYRRALALAPHDYRINDGVRALQKRQVNEELLKRAEATLARGDMDAADGLAQRVLAEDRANRRALEMRAEIERSRAKQESASPQLASRMTKPVTLEFRDAGVRMVFDVLARASGLNFILDKEIRSDARVTIYVRNVAVEDAIDLVLVQSQLEKKILSDNTLLVYPHTPEKLRAYQDLVIRSFYLVNSEAKETANLLKNILKVKDIQVDDRLNMIFLRDTPDTVRLAEQLIRNQDMAEPEVVLEMEVLEINRTRAVELGLSWPDTFTWLVPNPSNIKLDDLPFERNWTRDRVGVNATMQLRAKQVNGVSNVLSNPRIRVKNREQARVLVGDKVPVITATVTPGAVNPVTTETISYLDVGLKLDATPNILLDDDVSIKLALEVSTLGDAVKTNGGSVAYRVGTRNVTTTLRIRDGETQVLMGLIRDEERKSAGGVPGLTSLPLLGHLFSVPKNEKQKTEIVLSITPHIVRNVRRPQAEELEVWSGTESAMRSRRPIVHSDASARIVTPAPQPPTQPATQPATPEATAPQAAPTDATSTAETASAPVLSEVNAIPVAAEANQDDKQTSQRAARPVQFQWRAPAGAKVGETLVVGVETDAPAALMSVASSIKFDPKVLEVVDVSEGGFLQQGDAQTQFDQTVDGMGGRIAVSVSREGFGGQQGQGQLFNISFRVKAAAARSQIQITSLSPIGAERNPLPFSMSAPLALALEP